MKELCRSLYKEMHDLVVRADYAYESLNDALDAGFKQKDLVLKRRVQRKGKEGRKGAFEIRETVISTTPNAVQQEVKKRGGKIHQVRLKLEEVVVVDSLNSCAEAMHAMYESYKTLDHHLPTPEESDGLIGDIFDRYDKSEDGKYLRIAQRISPVTGLAALAFIPYHISIGDLTGGVISLVSAASSFSAPFFKKPYFNLMISHLGLAALTTTDLLFGKIPLDTLIPGAPEVGYIAGGYALWAFSALNFALGVGAGKFGLAKQRFRRLVKNISSARIKQDELLRVGVALSEGKRNLGYVSRVCESEGRDEGDFKEEVSVLQKAMEGYLAGRVSYDNLRHARIAYFAKETVELKPNVGGIPNSHLISSKKVGYTQDEYRTMKEGESVQQENWNRKRRRTRLFSKGGGEIGVSGPDMGDVPEEEGKRTYFVYEVGPILQKEYERGRRQIKGHGLVPLMDTLRERIEAVAEMRLAYHGDLALHHATRIATIPNKAQLAETHRILKARHNFPDDARLYKYDCTDYLRAIFAVSGPNIQLLEVMDHKDYSRLIGLPRADTV